MTDEARDPSPEFPINQQLLEDSTRSREQWRVLNDRLAKIDESKNQVSPAVYERVRRDYNERLQEATQELLLRKESVDKELRTLRETHKKIAVQLGEHRQRLEELKFRNTLGEFTEEEYQAQAQSAGDKIAKFETIINSVDNNISRYEEIFKNESQLFAQMPPPPSTVNVPKTTPATRTSSVPQEAEPVTDAKGFVLEEEGGPDYFSATPSARHKESDIGESATIKAFAIDDTDNKTEPVLKRARVVIISGEDAGGTYPIKGTVSFGRAESNTVVLKDAKVSRQHAQIQQQGNEYVLIDLNSSNGTYVNGQRIEEHVLSNGDEIHIGDYLLQFQN